MHSKERKTSIRRFSPLLHHPLHATSCYLNSQFFNSNPRIKNDPKTVEGLYKCIGRLTAKRMQIRLQMDCKWLDSPC